jgi:UPF0042 nucleotide-binding protein
MSEHTAGADVGTADGTGHAKPTSSELLVVTGMSGAGRSTAANALEDLGWYVVDNLPPQMLHTLADLVSRTPQALPKLAVVIDVRGKALFSDMKETLAALEASDVDFSVLFLDAADEVLVSRYEHQRRPHPLPTWSWTPPRSTCTPCPGPWPTCSPRTGPWSCA